MDIAKNTSTSVKSSTMSNKCKKLIGFSNWSQWTAFIKVILISKDIWDLIAIGSQLIRDKGLFWDYYRKEN